MKITTDATIDLMKAIRVCERSPILPPDLVEQPLDLEDLNLRNAVNEVKRCIPLLLLTSSAADLSQLTIKLNECAKLANEFARMQSDFERFVDFVSKFDDEITDLVAFAQEKADEAAAEEGA